MQIVLIEDDEQVRDATMEMLAPMAALGKANHLMALELTARPIVEQAAVKISRLFPFNESFAVLVLDLAFGDRSLAGLDMMRYLRYSFDGAVVIHSTQISDPKIRDQARALGIRFGCKKYDPELPSLIGYAYNVAFMRSATLGTALTYERNPIPDYEPPEGVPDLDEMFMRLKRIGRAYDGSTASVDWELVRETQVICRAHYDAANTQGYARFGQRLRADLARGEKPDPFFDFFEDFVVNAVPVLIDLERQFRIHTEAAEPHLTF